MSRILLKNASISFQQAQETVDILIHEGKIEEVKPTVISNEATTIDLTGKLVTSGWFDLMADWCDPGHEEREDMTSGANSATAGGYTGVCLIPNNDPVIDTKSSVEYLLNKNRDSLCNVHPIGALSKACKGENLAELFDLWSAGVSYFSDGTAPTWNAELLLKSLQYTQRFKAMVSVRPRDIQLSANGQMHEGVVSTSLGLPGMPSLSEVIAIKRDLEIQKYAGGRLHFSGISSAESVVLIKEAKEAGQNVTCDTPIFNLVFSDEVMPPFETNYKLDPPLRSEQDRLALISGLKEDTIDAITSNHLPRTEEEKSLEFDLADFGAISLQSVFPSFLKIAHEIELETLIKKVTDGPRKILGFDVLKIEENAPANLAVFDDSKVWTFNRASSLSKSENSPFWDQQLVGACIGVVNNGRVHFPELI